jgi:TonB-linked SusC/RagA family outer membrane protein
MKKKLTKTVIRVTILQIFLLLLFNCNVFANGISSIIVRGVVTSEKNEPVSGATVLLKGTKNGVTTDAQGKYEINAPADGILVFTSVGYLKQEIDVNNRTVVDVVLMEKNKELSQVIIVGYGTQKKSDLTGSVVTISGKDLQVAPTPDLFNNLAGKMPGVIATQTTGQPGFDQPTFVIRGQSTFGDNSALVLVDGIERTASGIDPNDIESVTILKDAASAAVYGARAANGVVLITTKQGKAGTTQISFSESYGKQSPTFRPQMMNSWQYATYWDEALVNSGNTAFYSAGDIAKFKAGNDPAYSNTDWWAASLHSSAPVNQSNLTLQGGTDKIKYLFSAGDLDQKGLYDLSSFRRNNLRSTVTYQVNDDLSVLVDVAGRVETTSQSPSNANGFTWILASKPTLKAFVPDSVARGGLAYNGTNGSPVGNFNNSGYNKITNTYLESTAEINYKLPWVKGLSAKARFAYDMSFSDNKTFTTPFTYYIYDNTNNIYNGIQTGAFPTLNEDRGQATQSTTQLSLNYDQKFGPHHISGLLLYEQMDGASSDISAYREGFLTPHIDQIFAGGAL